MTVFAEVNTLLKGLQGRDPRLYQALSQLNQRMREIEIEIAPVTTRVGLIVESATSPDVLPPTNFNYSFPGKTLRFTWDAAPSVSLYEVRRGADWATASFVLRTPTTQADLDPIAAGTYTYLVKSISFSGIYSELTTSLSVAVSEIAPVLITTIILDNNIQLRWETPESPFGVEYYVVYKDMVVQGIVTGTFISFFEQTDGTFRYAVSAVNILGETSEELLEVEVTLNAPPDYTLTDEGEATLGGTKVNVIVEQDLELTILRILACTVVETWSNHFITNGWATIQDQIDAGFPLYLEPTNATGSYQEDFDFGVALTNVIARVAYNDIQFGSGTVTVVVKMATSPDGSTWSAFTSGAVQFFPAFRYIRLKLEFTGSDTKSLMEVCNIIIRLDVKRTIDEGRVSALSTDVGGTPVNFNKAFHDVESITATAQDTTGPFTVNIDFTDIPDPTTFYVYVFNSAGARVSKTVDWKARGII